MERRGFLGRAFASVAALLGFGATARADAYIRGVENEFKGANPDFKFRELPVMPPLADPGARYNPYALEPGERIAMITAGCLDFSDPRLYRLRSEPSTMWEAWRGHAVGEVQVVPDPNLPYEIRQREIGNMPRASEVPLYGIVFVGTLDEIMADLRRKVERAIGVMKAPVVAEGEAGGLWRERWDKAQATYAEICGDRGLVELPLTEQGNDPRFALFDRALESWLEKRRERGGDPA